METKTIWLDGKFVAAAEATCAISCASLMDGMVVLEDDPLVQKRARRLHVSCGRPCKAVRTFGENRADRVPHASSKLAKAALKVAKASVADGVDKGIVRFIAYFGGAAPIDGSLPLGGRASVAIFCMPFSGEAKSISAGSDACSGCGDSLPDADRVIPR